ncbi:MAG: hypothetical protein KAR42_13300 [candidate division Zixibacteria bacterium]|nr:hypothetical protein [candidate division Zixibacteria bacterium]
MSKKQLYVSRDMKGWFEIWEGRPKWHKEASDFIGGCNQFLYTAARWGKFKRLFPQLKKLEPGQIAKVQRDMVEVYTDFPKVAVLTLGKIIEDHGKK